jgi:hypothetical protein
LIANSFQDWNAIRNCDNSTGQFFINSLAFNIEHAANYWKTFRKELFLDTADLSQVDYVGRIGMPDYIKLDKFDDKNILSNGAFEYSTTARLNLPEAWTDKWSYTTGEVFYTNEDSLVAGGVVKIVSPVGAISCIAQTQQIVLNRGTNLTLSVWYKNDISSDRNSSTPYAYLKLLTVNDSGHTYEYKTPLNIGTNLNWNRAYVTQVLTEDIGKVEARVEIESSEQFGDTNNWYYIGALQLEKSDYPTSFSHKSYDVPEWMRHMEVYTRPSFSMVRIYDREGVIGYDDLTPTCTGVLIKSHPVHYIEDRNLFLDNGLVPTRIEEIYTTGGTSATSNNILGIFASPLYRPREKGWALWGNTGFFTYEFPNQEDTGRFYNIADYGIDKLPTNNNFAFAQQDLHLKRTVSSSDPQQTGLGYSLDLKTFTINKGFIWAIGTETYTGSTINVLKIIDPKTEYNSTYLEVVRDFRLEYSGVPTAVGFVTNTPNQLVVSLSGNPAYSGCLINLYYDYFTIDRETRQAFTRELYNGINDQVIIY